MTVVTGLRKLKLEVRERLAVLSPDTDLTQVVVLDWRTPRDANWVYNSMLGGGAAILLGFFGLLVVYFRAWNAVGELVRDTISDHEGDAIPTEV